MNNYRYVIILKHVLQPCPLDKLSEVKWTILQGCEKTSQHGLMFSKSQTKHWLRQIAISSDYSPHKFGTFTKTYQKCPKLNPKPITLGWHRFLVITFKRLLPTGENDQILPEILVFYCLTSLDFLLKAFSQPKNQGTPQPPKYCLQISTAAYLSSSSWHGTDQHINILLSPTQPRQHLHV